MKVSEIMQLKEYKGIPYRFYVPDDYDKDKSYPFILIFHGHGERGNDGLTFLRNINQLLIRLLLDENNRKNYPCIIVAPQCPTTDLWTCLGKPDVENRSTNLNEYPFNKSLEIVSELVEKTESEYNIDKSHCIITGLSMGGGATLELALRKPDLFSTIIPVCAAQIYPENASILKDKKVWLFHGLSDNMVDPKYSKIMFESLHKINQNVKVTYYENVLHNSWINAYNEPELLDYIFK